jgi:hypothetical protein
VILTLAVCLTFANKIKRLLVFLRVDRPHNNAYCLLMEKRVLSLELAVEQNTAMGERLDRSMALLTQSMADLRVQMVQGFAGVRQEITSVKAELRQEITSVKAELQQEIASVQLELRQEISASQTELRKEISASQSELRKEIAASHAELHKFFERKFMWLLTAYSGGLLTLVGFLGKYLIDSYAK